MIPRTVLLIILTVAALPLWPQAQETVNVTAIEVVAVVHDKTGFAPKDLKASDFIVLEDGVERKVIGLDYLASRPAAPVTTIVEAPAAAPEPVAPPPPPWHFVFYFESELSGAQGRGLVAEAIGRDVERYVSLGTVDVVFATPTPVALVQASRDPQAIRDALQKVKKHGGVNQLVLNRRRFRDSMVGRIAPADFNDIRPFLDDDIRLVNLFRRNLASWLSSYRRHSPRMAIVVTDGFDLDPVNFYVTESGRNPMDQALLRATAFGAELATGTSDLAKALAGGSWIISSVPGQMDMGMTVDDASTWGIGRVTGPVAVGRLGAKALVELPMSPLMVLAAATGGTVVGNHSKLGQALDHLGRYVKLTYQVGRAPDGRIRKVEVRSRRRDLTVRAQQWVAESTPEETASTRVVGLLDGAEQTGELPVQAAVTLDAASKGRRGVVHGSVDLGALSLLIEQNGSRNFRVTVATRQGSKTNVISRIASNIDVSEGSFPFRIGLDFPEGVSALVITVEDLATGAWGGARVTAKEMTTE